MRKNHLKPAVAIFLSAVFFLQCNNNKTGSQQLSDNLTGLIFATEAEYKKVAPAELPFGATDLPLSLDYSSDMPQIGNQGRQNSCVGWATAYALKSYQEKLETRATLLFSPSFIYNQINLGEDKGAKFIDALNLLSQQGASLWDDMPYNEADFISQPSETAKQKAKPYSIYQWRRVNTQDIKEVKMQVNAGYPVVIGADVDEGFKAGKMNETNEYVWNSSVGRGLGGHAMVVVGFNDSKNAFKVMNSWGSSWGNNGYCWIDYQFFPKVVREGYIALDQKTNVTPDTRPDTEPDVKPDDIEIITKPEYDQFAKASLRGVQVQHNVMDNVYGYCMKISGYIDIPAGFGRTFQISNHFYLSNSTQQAKSLMYPTFADVNGYAATGSILYSVPPDGLQNYYWECLMPYKALELPYEMTYFYFIPTLFIDNFGYAKGQAINFSVDRRYVY